MNDKHKEIENKKSTAASSVIKDQESNSSWGHIHQDLSSALNNWDEITKKFENSQSPEEKKLAEMKRLLGELKQQIELFSQK